MEFATIPRAVMRHAQSDAELFGHEGACPTFFEDGSAFQISYLGGDGNDVTITRVIPEPTVIGLGALVGLGTLARRPRRRMS